MKNKRKTINTFLNTFMSLSFKSILLHPSVAHLDGYYYYSNIVIGATPNYMWIKNPDTYIRCSDQKQFTLKQFQKYCGRMLALKAFW